ncbi:SusC/RagA family TonB-linked outer membrane protein [Mucilaginibacter pedocola]|uniref:SusC/RagA family TonB-linked outer membrane protein n=1 Tax=Mucilaginibacter pedocola TaxID=1792845 RepID=UPI00192E3876|nr:TonB-dependent receptor [Mucilaginibacter pedocola]
MKRYLLKSVHRFVCIGVLALLFILKAQAQQTINVTGVVTEQATGKPLPGVTVKVKGTTNGIVTDVNGGYKLTVPQDAVLQYSFIGFEPIERTAAARADVQLVAKQGSLNEVVVVGYGTRKKATLTGSIASVKGSEVAKSPAGNVSNSLAGRLPGLVAVTRTGEPGNDGSTLRIRGANTLGDNSPLVVIDGIANRNLERLDPSTIESVTVLKDASAAIYGAQAANGVILVTTKRGTSGKPTIQLNLNQGWNTPTVLPKMADAPLYAQLQNEISEAYHPGSPLPYSAEDIEKYANGSDPWGHPNTDWFKETIKSNSPQRYGNLTLSGGSDAVKYFTSLGSNFTDGMFRNSNINYSQTNFQSNLDARVSKDIRLSFDITGRQENRNYSGGGNNGGSTDAAQNIFWALNRAFPTTPAYWPNGLPGPAIEYGANPVVLVTDKTGYTHQRDYVFQSNMRLVINIPWVQGLSLTGNAAVDKTFVQYKQFRKPWNLYTWDKVTYDANNQPLLLASKSGNTDPRVYQSSNVVGLTTLNALLNYDRAFGKHDLKVLAATERISGDNMYFWAFRRNYTSDILPELDLGSNALKDNGGNSGVTRRLDYFGRVSYAYDSKYLAEFVWRYDGSYIFDPNGQQFGFFPGVSLGYRISNEKFWKENLSFINEFKLRGSWGRTGNDRIGPYQYMTTYGYNGAYVFNQSTVQQTLTALRIPNAGVTWEVANQSNIGLDAQLLDGKITISGDYFYNLRSNILAYRNASVPGSAGLSLPQENIGKVVNKGFELQIGYQNRAGDFVYSVSANGAYSKNHIQYWDETPGVPDYQRSTGSQMNANLYYQSMGVFKDQAAVDAYPHWPGARPGDIIFKDVNNDGVINGLDQVRSKKTSIPTFTGGLNINLQYKNFDASILFQGAAGAERAYTAFSGGPGVGNFMYNLIKDRWTPQNPSSTNPRAWERGGAYWMTDGMPNNTYFVRSSDYLRLKNFELGYTLSSSISKRMGIQTMRVFASGLNMLTFTKMKDFDPESPDTAPGSIWVNSQVYPLNKTINVGLSVTF